MKKNSSNYANIKEMFSKVNNSNSKQRIITDINSSSNKKRKANEA